MDIYINGFDNNYLRIRERLKIVKNHVDSLLNHNLGGMMVTNISSNSTLPSALLGGAPGIG